MVGYRKKDDCLLIIGLRDSPSELRERKLVLEATEKRKSKEG